MSTKGSWSRPSQISREERDLRYTLAFECEGDPEKKEKILKLLNELLDKNSK